MEELMERQILNEEEKAYLTKIENSIRDIEKRENRTVSIKEELAMRKAITIDEFETLLYNKAKERCSNNGIL